MINNSENPAAWPLLLTEIDEAREHLEELVSIMNEAGTIDEAEYATYLGHIYAHLNRAWNSRNQSQEITEEQWHLYSQFPKDIKPIG